MEYSKKIYTCVLAFFCLSPLSSATTFDVETAYTVLNVSGSKPVLERSYKYRCQIDATSGTNWCITNLDVPDAIAFTYNDYILNKLATGLTNSLYAAASVYDGYPLDLDAQVRLPWLVYCGGSYLKGLGKKMAILPNGDPRMDVESSSCTAESTWQQEGDLTASTIRFSFNPEAFENAVTNLTFEPSGDFLEGRLARLETLKARLKPGLVMATLDVTEWTAFGGRRIPAKWVYKTFSSAGPLRVYEGKTVGMAQRESIQYPTLPTSAKLIDKRVRKTEPLNYVAYSITNGTVPTVDSAFVKSKVATHLKHDHQSQLPQETVRRNRIVFVLLIGVVIAIPFLFFLNRGKASAT